MTELPSTTEVEAALHTAAGIESVEYRRVPPETWQSLYSGGPVHEPGYDQFVYRGEKGWGVIEVRQRSNGEKTLRLYVSWLGKAPSREKVEQARSLIALVYEHLRAQLIGVPPIVEAPEQFDGIPRRLR